MTKATTSKTDNANVTQAKINGPKAAAMSSDTAKAVTKQTLVLNLLTRAKGATLGDLVKATGWLPHTTRAMLTILRKKGHKVESDKADGVRTYRITPEAVAGE